MEVKSRIELKEDVGRPGLLLPSLIPCDLGQLTSLSWPQFPSSLKWKRVTPKQVAALPFSPMRSP